MPVDELKVAAGKAIEFFTPDKNTIHKYVPGIRRARTYNAEKFMRDLIAGVTVGLMVVPQGLAYAKLAALPVQYGLYSSYIGLLIYMVFGTSNVISIGPVAVLSLLVGTAVGKDKDPVAHAVALSCICGLIQLVLGITRLGVFVHILSKPVIKGFTTASAFTIICTQVPSILGLRKPSVGTSFPRDAIGCLDEVFKVLKTAKSADVVMSVICIAFLAAMQALRLLKFKNKRVEISVQILSNCRHFIVVILATAAAYANLRLRENLKLSDKVPKGMPITLVPQFHDFPNLLKEGLPLAFIGFIEHYSIAMNFAALPGAESDVDPVQEWISLGIMNLFGSFFRAYPITGSFSRSSVKAKAGVRTPFCGLWTALIVIFALLFLTPVFQYIPSAALASVIVMSVWELVCLAFLWKLWKSDKKEFIVMVLTVVIGIWVDIEIGIAVGIIASLFFLLHTHLYATRTNYAVPSKACHIVAFNSSLYYPCMFDLERSVDELLREADPPLKLVVLDFTECVSIDFGTAEGLWLLRAKFQSLGVTLKFVNLKASLFTRMYKMRPSGVVLEDVFYGSLGDAIGCSAMDIILIRGPAEQTGGEIFDVSRRCSSPRSPNSKPLLGFQQEPNEEGSPVAAPLDTTPLEKG